MCPVTDLDLDSFPRIVFFTGAGISAESGVPTYRGAGGIWKTYDYRAYACQDAFDRDPAGVWEFHNYRRSIVGACDPNGGHEFIAALQKRRDGVRVVTQNIDGLHQLAGSEDVTEVHGSLWRVRCQGCGAHREGRETPLTELRCTCGGWWRPAITWFGDALDPVAFGAAHEAALNCDLLIMVGTSGAVWPAAGLPGEARRAGATIVEVNPEDTELTDIAHHVLRGTATEVLGGMG